MRATQRYEEYTRTPEHLAVLDHVIADLRRCLLLVPPDEAEGLAIVQLRLGTAICKRWQAEGGERLAESVELLVKASQGPLSTPAERSIALSNLAGVAFDESWRALGTTAACAAIELGGSAENLAAANENLAHNQLALFERTGDTNALLEGLHRFETAARATPLDGPDRARRLCGLATAISLGRQVLGTTYDLERGVVLVRNALTMTPPGHPDRPTMLGQLSSLLLAGFRERPDLARIEEAAALSARAADESTGRDEWSAFQINRVGVLLQWARHTGRSDVLDLADEVSAQILQALPPTHVHRATALQARGAVEVLRRRPESALEYFEASARTPDAPLRQVEVARKAAAMAGEMGLWQRAADTLAHAVSLLPRLTSRRLARFDQERLLAQVSGLAREACAYAIQAGDAVSALVVLERGRGVLFRQLLDDRDDLEELRRVRPDLAARLDACRDVFTLPPSDDPLVRDEIHATADEWARVVAEARGVPGFEALFAPPGFDELREAAADGPVVVVNVAALRTDALVLTSAGVEVVPLPEAGAPVAQEQFRTFIKAAGDGGSCPVETLAWLWDAVAKPVLERLRIGSHRDVGPWPRIWWSPTGPLVFLPLHAAGRHTEDSASVLDRAISSYAPTVEGLVRTKRRPAVPLGGARLAVIAIPQVPGFKTLKGVPDEVRAIRDHVEQAPTVLDGEHAVRAAVLDTLARCEWVHLACHAAQSVRMPTGGCLILKDHEKVPLTVQDIAQLNLSSAEFAYLSACATGRGGIALTEEAVHLASAFQVAGYRHVVATLWPIYDPVAPVFARAVYRAITDGGVGDAALAVHETARLLRDKGVPPIVWAAHFHTGP